MTKRILVGFIVILASSSLLIWLGSSNWRRFREQARLSEAKSIISGLIAAERAYHQEWGQFTSKLEDAGFATDWSKLRYKLFTDSATLAPEIREKLSPSELPTMEKDHFRFILAGPCDDSGLTCLVIFNETEVTIKSLKLVP